MLDLGLYFTYFTFFFDLVPLGGSLELESFTWEILFDVNIVYLGVVGKISYCGCARIDHLERCAGNQTFLFYFIT